MPEIAITTTSGSGTTAGDAPIATTGIISAVVVTCGGGTPQLVLSEIGGRTLLTETLAEGENVFYPSVELHKPDGTASGTYAQYYVERAQLRATIANGTAAAHTVHIQVIRL